MSLSKEDREQNREMEQIRLDIHSIQFIDNITGMDFSFRNMSDQDFGSVSYPPNLVNLNLSHNQMSVVPQGVMQLTKVAGLNLSFNNIKKFDEKPKFCGVIRMLNMSNNSLESPPYWIWSESPRNLKYLNLSSNENISKLMNKETMKKYLQHECKVEEIVMFGCKLQKRRDLKLLSTFTKADRVEVGMSNFQTYGANHINVLPNPVLVNRENVKYLDVSNTKIYDIKSSIGDYKNMTELLLSQNQIRRLPNEFCDMTNLKICKLSLNKIKYLPSDTWKLVNLSELYLDGNLLVAYPDNLPALSVLDLYDNFLTELPDYVFEVKKLDVALNYFEEPEHEDYRRKKYKLRFNKEDRMDGRKLDDPEPEDLYEIERSDESSDELLPSTGSDIVLRGRLKT